MSSINNNKTWVEISTKALLHNTETLRRILDPKTKLMAVIKSNAYGHGLLETASIFSKLGISWFGVDNIEDAILLRKNNIKGSVLIMGHAERGGMLEAIKYDLSPEIYDSRVLAGLSSSQLKKLRVHIKVDTGMSRQGVLVSDLPRFLNSLPRELNIEGVFTHFANADRVGDLNYSKLQLVNFKKAIAIMRENKREPQIIHADNSSGVFSMPDARFSIVRTGLALYGLWPSQELARKFKKVSLEPALEWKTRIVQIKDIKKGTPVGYGITERVSKDSRIAILPVGYYDGYDRRLSSTGEVIVGGKKCKILGRISMNLSVADISKVANPRVWDEVVLIGGQGNETITVEEIAKKIGTINYEVITRINPLLKRVYI